MKTAFKTRYLLEASVVSGTKFLATMLIVVTSLVARPADAQTPDAQTPDRALRSPQPAAFPQVSLENTEVRRLHSKIVGEDFRLLIFRPFERPGSGGGPYPVLYLLDGQIAFPMVRQIVLSLQSGFEMPPVFIVGIDYAEGRRAAMQGRTRDFTPTADPVFVKHARQWGAAGPGDEASGGASAFLEFIREELQPFIEGNYPVAADDATIIGASFGGLFAAYTLFHRPDTFERYILSSPSLWWGGRVTFEHEARFAAKHEDLAARVFIGVGGNETEAHDEEYLTRLPAPIRASMLAFKDAMKGSAQMLEAVEPFVRILRSRNYPSLNMSFHVFPEETHGSVPPMVISRGLRELFRQP